MISNFKTTPHFKIFQNYTPAIPAGGKVLAAKPYGSQSFNTAVNNGMDFYEIHSNKGVGLYEKLLQNRSATTL
jgi:hypothetical protein